VKNLLLIVTRSVLIAALMLGLYEAIRWLYYQRTSKVPRTRGRDEILGWAVAAALAIMLVQSCPNLLDR
jgi:hypothetical protein